MDERSPAYAEPNELERAFLAFAEDSTLRGAFMRTLLESELILAATIEEDGRIAFETASTDDGVELVPFYTSEAVLQAARPEVRDHLHMPARELFATVRARACVMNPGVAPNMTFPVGKLDNLLDFGWEGAEWVREQDGQAAEMSLPDEEPTAMIAAMATILSRHPGVRAAYLGLTQLDVESAPGIEAPTHVAIGLDADDDVIAAATADLAGAVHLGPSPSMMVMGVGAADEDDLESVPGWLVQKGLKVYERDAGAR